MEKTPNKPHDAFIRRLLKHKESAIAFLQQVLPAEMQLALDWQGLVYISETYITPQLREFISDIVVRLPLLEGEYEIEVTILIEHKSDADPLSGMQLLSYIANGYQQQMKQGGKLSVIVPVVYYHGKRDWQIGSLASLFEGLPAFYTRYIPRFDIEMLRVQDLSVEQIHMLTEAKLRAALMIHKGMHDQVVALEEYVRVFNALSPARDKKFLISMFIYIDKVHIFEDEEIFIITEQLDKEMNTESMTFSDRLKARSREEGLREGIEKGMEKGMEKGLEQGLEKGIVQGTTRGMQEAKLAFAKKLLDRKFSIQDIAELTGLSQEDVAKIISGER